MEFRIEKFIFLYCVLAIINIPKVYFFDSPDLRLLDWYINDIIYVFRVFIVFIPLALGMKIDTKMYWGTRKEYLLNLVNRFFFILLLLLNYGTVLLDYSFMTNDLWYDKLISMPKATLAIMLIMVNWHIINKQKE